MAQKHERPIPPFADIHVEDGKIRVTLLHDPVVEGLDAALYLDSSGSMSDEYTYDKPVPGTASRVVLERGWIRRLFGLAPKTITRGAEYTNEVEPQARRMLAFLAGKDRNGKLRVAYWSDEVTVVGEIDAQQAATQRFEGAGGGGTHLAPAIQDYVRYLEAQAAQGARRGLMVIMTDGEVQDEAAVVRELEAVARRMRAGALPPVSFLVVGVGEGVKEEQLERLAHREYGGVDHLVCHKIAAEIDQVAEIASALVDENMTVAPSGVLYDEYMAVLRRFPDRMPAVFEFDARPGQKHFTLEMNGQRYGQRIPDEEHHGEDETATAD